MAGYIGGNYFPDLSGSLVVYDSYARAGNIWYSMVTRSITETDTKVTLTWDFYVSTNFNAGAGIKIMPFFRVAGNIDYNQNTWLGPLSSSMGDYCTHAGTISFDKTDIARSLAMYCNIQGAFLRSNGSGWSEVSSGTINYYAFFGKPPTQPDPPDIQPSDAKLSVQVKTDKVAMPPASTGGKLAFYTSDGKPHTGQVYVYDSSGAPRKASKLYVYNSSGSPREGASL